MKSNRKKLTGVVVKDKMQKTVVVQVTRSVIHPKWKKIVTIKKKFYAHDQKDEYQVGDKVIIEENHPVSKLKKWRVIKRLESKDLKLERGEKENWG